MLFAALLLAESINYARTLLAQGNPDPKPSNHLDEHESEEDAVLEAVKTRRSAVLERIRRVARCSAHSHEGREWAEEVRKRDG